MTDLLENSWSTLVRDLNLSSAHAKNLRVKIDAISCQDRKFKIDDFNRTKDVLSELVKKKKERLDFAGISENPYLSCCWAVVRRQN